MQEQYNLRTSLLSTALIAVSFLITMGCAGQKGKSKSSAHPVKGQNTPAALDSLQDYLKSTEIATKVDSSIRRYIFETDTKEGLVLASKGDKEGYVNLKGEVIIPLFMNEVVLANFQRA